jgi:hypothetical protein
MSVIDRTELVRGQHLAAADVEAVAGRAAADAGLGTDLLGAYLSDAMDVASTGRRLSPDQLEEYQRLGGRAAEDGVGLPALLDLYLSATWRLWDTMTSAVGGAPRPDSSVASALFRAADDAAAALGRGYTRAQRRAIRREEALRRELVDDLLAGRHGPETHQQARRAGFNLAASHRVIVAEAAAPVHDAGPVQWAVEAALVDDLHRGGFVATRDGRLVCVLPAADADPAVVLRAVATVAPGDWRLGVGQAHDGAAGVGESHREAIQALDLAAALGLSTRVVDIAALAPFGILTQNPQLLGQVVHDVFQPLAAARSGAGPLIDTLEAYFDEGLSTTGAARRLHLSVRAVSYRLARVERLTGRSLRDPLDRFALELAVRGDRLLRTVAAGTRQPT